MDRSRRETGDAGRVPSASRLTVRARKNRKRATSWSGSLPSAKSLVDGCGRLVRRALPAAITLTLAGGLGAGGYLGYRIVTTSSRFAITAIEIRGATHVDAGKLRARLPTHVGDNVFLTDLDAARAAVLADPWVATAEVSRTLPHTLVITVRERTAVALVDLGSLYLVDATGHPFKRAAIDETAGLPIITGLDRDTYAASPDHAAGLVRQGLAALADWNAATPARPAIGEVGIDPFGALTLHTYEHATAIQLGALGPELAARMHTFDAAWAELTDAERDRTRAIHLTRPDHVTVAFAK